jgi:uncharacterized protein (DUF1778 family)
MKDAVAVLIEAQELEKTVRINVTARESQIAAIDRLASAFGLTRSAFMVRSALGARKPGRGARKAG